LRVKVSSGGGQGQRRGAREVGVLDRASGLQVGDHICWTYTSDEEHRQVLTTFFSEGVTRGEKLFYLSSGNSAERLLDALEDEGQPVEDLLATGRLAVKAAEDAYTPGGVFDPDALLAFLRDLVERAFQEGCTGLRGAGEVAWLQRRPDVEDRWGGYELRVDLLATQLPYTGLCCYDLRECDAATTEIPRAVHPLWLTPPVPDDAPPYGVHGTADGALGLAGEIDCCCAEDVRVLLAAAAKDLHEPALDVSLLRFADVAAMRTIAATAHELARRHGRIQLRGTSPTFRKVWRLLRLDSHIAAELS
jgi:anti-anti-sigma regulatory factor